MRKLKKKFVMLYNNKGILQNVFIKLISKYKMYKIYYKFITKIYTLKVFIFNKQKMHIKLYN